MDHSLLVITAGVFLTLVAGGIGLYRMSRDSEGRRVRERLRSLAPRAQNAAPVKTALLKDLKYSGLPAVDAMLRKTRWAHAVYRILAQGEIKMRVAPFLLLVLVAGTAGAALSIMILREPLLILPSAAVPGALPFLWAYRRKVRRVKRFERVFPDALDILTGALRSGLALTGAIQVVAEECANPVAGEFSILFDEIRLGTDTRLALRNLAERVDSKELDLFVIAVLLQRDTGGNLAEILEGTAFVIRDRLRILGDVRALTGQARLSAVILSALPVALAIFILASAPDYMRGLTQDPMGRYLVFGAVGLQLIGYFAMRRIATIRV